MVHCHGLPGNQKNLDLAQAVRRAGWDAVTFNYRGSWGSPGSFSFAHTLEDAACVLAYLRVPANAHAVGIDPARIVLAGQSMGGWVLTSDDGNGPNDMALITAIQKLGGHQVSQAHAATDHSWSDHRIALEALVVNWLAALHGK